MAATNPSASRSITPITSVSKQSSESFSGSNLIKGRWKVLKKIGAGAFGEIYSAKNIITGEMVAIKVERTDSKKQVLKLEVAVLKKLQGCAQVCRFITCGRFNEYNYMVMELLGENLSELRRRQPDGRFSMGTTIKLGKQMLSALECVHDLGYLHRDVKPSNFAMGSVGAKRSVAYLIDYGLARRYLLSSGEVRPPRDSTGFRGTARYASINSHLSKDLGRRDDLWSVFYVLVEFAQGYLPWRKLKDKDQIGEMKIKYNTPDLVKDLPPLFLNFMKHLKNLNYIDRPDYNYLQSLLDDLYSSLGCDDNTPYDWELAHSSSTQSVGKSNTANMATSPYQTSNNADGEVGFSRARETPENSTTRDQVEKSPQVSRSLRPYSTAAALDPRGFDEKGKRRSSETASVIAASSENEQDGSWNPKSNPLNNANNNNSSNLEPSVSRTSLKGNIGIAEGNVSIQIIDDENEQGSNGNSPNNTTPSNGAAEVGYSSGTSHPGYSPQVNTKVERDKEMDSGCGCKGCVVQE
eukprot:TRINITY_DN5216_c0_g2_i2.p1 TRINITY_DN5216_c0_g2~~TRINITY_DN5216_c0_g2_i2.p1  ORF type:complete len:522 (-),score=74.99 TRINITY_DN5216_c0_g2_i2:62-1627(-)